MQLGPDDSVSFPTVYGARYNVVSLFLCVIKNTTEKVFKKYHGNSRSTSMLNVETI